MTASPLRRRLLWLAAIRAGAVTLLLGAGIFFAATTQPVRGAFFFLIALTYALTLVYVTTLRWAERHPWLLDLQFAADALIISGIVLATGGAQSYFSSLYALPIIAATSVRMLRGGVTTAVISAGFYVAVVAWQYSGQTSPLIPGVAADLTIPQALFTIGLNLFGFASVAVLSGELADRLRVTGQELARTSSELAELQAFNAYVIDSLTSGLVTVDQHGVLVSFNPAAELITGIPAAQAIGRPARDVMQLPEAFAESIEEKDTEPRRTEFAFMKDDRRQIQIGLSTAPLVTPQGQAGRLLTFQDVTDARRREREARIQQRLAAVGEMAAGIAHEIRNPLAAMSGSIQVLRQELPLNPEQAQLMEIVLRESERLNNTIKSFLAYARPQRATLQKMDLRKALHDTATLLRNSAEMKEAHKLVVDTPDEPVIFEADEAQIKQIVWNLATNGLRAMPEGGRLRMSTSGNGQGAELAVQDDGVGIPQEELDGIFQPFRGAFFKGSGLGLSIVHRIVSDYGGEILVTSESGSGTTVTVRLPVQTVEQHA